MVSNAKKLVTRFINALNEAGADEARLAEARGLLHRDVIVSVVGSTPLSGRFENLNIVDRVLVNTAKRLLSALNVRVLRLIGEGHTVAALTEFRATTKGGKVIGDVGEVTGCVFEIEEGLITEIQIFADTSLIDLELLGWAFVANSDMVKAGEIGS